MGKLVNQYDIQGNRGIGVERNPEVMDAKLKKAQRLRQIGKWLRLFYRRNRNRSRTEDERSVREESMEDDEKIEEEEEDIGKRRGRKEEDPFNLGDNPSNKMIGKVLVSIDHSLKTLEKSVKTLERRVNHIEVDLKWMRKEMSKTNQRLDRLEVRMDGFEERLSNLEREVSPQETSALLAPLNEIDSVVNPSSQGSKNQKKESKNIIPSNNK